MTAEDRLAQFLLNVRVAHDSAYSGYLGACLDALIAGTNMPSSSELLIPRTWLSHSIGRASVAWLWATGLSQKQIADAFGYKNPSQINVAINEFCRTVCGVPPYTRNTWSGSTTLNIQGTYRRGVLIDFFGVTERDIKLRKMTTAREILAQLVRFAN